MQSRNHGTAPRLPVPAEHCCLGGQQAFKIHRATQDERFLILIIICLLLPPFFGSILHSQVIFQWIRQYWYFKATEESVLGIHAGLWQHESISSQARLERFVFQCRTCYVRICDGNKLHSWQLLLMLNRWG